MIDSIKFALLMVTISCTISSRAIAQFQDPQELRPSSEIDASPQGSSGAGGLITPQIAIPTPSGVVTGYPFILGDTNVNPRVSAYFDTTRLNPNAVGLFLPSAIPVKGDAYFGSGPQSNFTTNGTGTGLGFSTPGTAFSGQVELNLQSSSTDSLVVTLPTAIVKWNWLSLGITDSTFTDPDALPDADDQGGPIGRPMIRNTMGAAGQPQMRFALVEPDEVTGLFSNVGIEMPGADVLFPVTVPVPGLPSVAHYSSFARYPDLVGTVRYQDGGMAKDAWTTKRFPYENWHVQFGVLIRDLGVQGDGKAVPSIRETTTGWGMQVSGRFTVFGREDPVNGCHDYAMFSLSFGEGIGHYFPDLHVISAVNDAAFNSTTSTIAALPVFTYFAGYQHDWTQNLRSSVVYSHIHLDSQEIPGNSTVPYKNGNYLLANLVWHNTFKIKDSSSKNLEVELFGGVEYLRGQRENFANASGADQRIMLFVAAAK